MICVGAPTPDRSAGNCSAPPRRRLLNVPIPRSRSSGPIPTVVLREGGVVSVVLDDEPDNDAVVHLAMDEGRLRYAVVCSGKSIGASTIGFAAIPMFTSKLAAGTGCRYGDSSHQHAGVQLAVVGQADADKITHSRFPTAIPSSTIPRARCCHDRAPQRLISVRMRLDHGVLIGSMVTPILAGAGAVGWAATLLPPAWLSTWELNEAIRNMSLPTGLSELACHGPQWCTAQSCRGAQ